MLELWGEVKKIRAGNWDVNILLDDPIEIPRAHIPQLLSSIERATKGWQESAVKEPTLVWREFNLPSLVVRVDYTVNNESEVKIYELEERPAALGMACQYVPNFAFALQDLEWPSRTVVVTRRPQIEDSLWTTVIRPEEYEQSELNGFYNIARIEPFELNETLYNKIAVKSISTIRTKGWKGYGSGWLWDTFQPSSFDQLANICNVVANKQKWPGLVIKADGSKARNVRIWLTSKTVKQVREHLRSVGGIGIWSASEIFAAYQQWKKEGLQVYLQQFYWPIPVRINKLPYYAIWRVYFGFDIQEKNWVCLGGFLNARPSLLIHGATDAIFIPAPVP